jgi:membrane-associated protein
MVHPEPVISFLQDFSYIGAFSSVVVSGYILPVPEEVVLLTIGYLAGSGFFNVYVVIFVAFLATLASDVFLYSLAKKDSKFTRKMKRKMHDTQFCKSCMKSPRTIGKVVFLMRFCVGLRFLGPILAGALNVPLRKFIFYDTLALLLYTPFFVFLGYYFHTSFLNIVTHVDSIRHMLFAILVTGIGILLLNLAQRNLWRVGIGSRKAPEFEEERD